MGGLEKYRRIKLTALGGKMLAGAFRTDYSSIFPAETGASDCIEVRSSGDEGILLPLSISIPPGNYSSEGFRLVVTDAGGLTREAMLTPPSEYIAGAQYSIDINGSLPHPESGKISVRRPDRAWEEGETIVVNGRLSLPLGAEEAGGESAVFEISGAEAPYCVAWPAEALSSYENERGAVLIPAEQTAGASAPVLIGRADDALVTLSEATCTINITSETLTGGWESIRNRCSKVGVVKTLRDIYRADMDFWDPIMEKADFDTRDYHYFCWDGGYHWWYGYQYQKVNFKTGDRTDLDTWHPNFRECWAYHFWLEKDKNGVLQLIIK